MLKKVRYNIILNPNYVAAIDVAAARAQQSRSSYINEMLKQHVEDNNLLFPPAVMQGQQVLEGV